MCSVALDFQPWPARIVAVVLAGLAGCLLALPGAAQVPTGSGLRSLPAEYVPRLQIRLGVTSLSYGLGLSPPAVGAAIAAEPPIRTATLLGDVYLGESGGLRATGGLLLGRHAMPWSGVPRLGQSVNLDIHRLRRGASETLSHSGDVPVASKVPYLGLGYSSAAWAGGWGFSADLGLMALAPGRIGGALSGQRSVEDVLRDLRLTPTLQFGASYSF